MLITDHPAAVSVDDILVAPGDPGWDDARRTFNLTLDQRPSAVARPRDEREVAAVVRHAHERGLRLAAQCTGHNAGPLGDLSDTILVNTSRLTGVSIDATARRVRAGAGTRWEDVTPAVAELGLAALHGSSPDVGIVGYSLGGGLGWLARSRGLQCNSVTAIELVTADGDLIRCDAVHEPELFWALRGGGGNFGIVTAIEFAVYPLTEVYAGAMFFAYDRATEVIGTWQAMLAGLPSELTSQASIMHLPDLPFVPQPLRGGSFAVIIAAFTGTEAEGSRLLAPIRALQPAIDTFAMAGPDVLAQLAMDPPDPLPYASTHALLGELSAEATKALVATAGPSSGIAALQLRHLGGALATGPEGAGARATLDGHLTLFAVGMVLDETTAAAVAGSLHQIAAVSEPHRVGAYASFVEEPADAATLYDPATWTRLRAVKALYDPADLIRGNHHVPPAR